MFLAIVYIVLGILILWVAIKKKTTSNKLSYSISIFLLVAGISMIYGKIKNNDIILMFSCSLSIGSICLIVPIYKVYCILTCNKIIEATYVKANIYRHTHKGFTSTQYSPVFTYRNEKRKVEVQAFQTIGKRKLKRKYKSGEKYKLYINEKKSTIALVNKRITLFELMMLVIGVLLLIKVGLLF